MILIRYLQHLHRLFIVIKDRFIRNHLRIDQTCAEFKTKLSECVVGDPGHRSYDDRTFDLLISDQKHSSSILQYRRDRNDIPCHRIHTSHRYCHPERSP